MAFALIENRWVGTYYGRDSNRAFVEWSQRHITSKHPNYQFAHVDISQPDSHILPFADNTFDLVGLHSVFTHIPADNIQRHLAEYRRVLKPGSRCYVTVFLITDLTRAEFQPVVNGSSQWKPNTFAIEESRLRELIGQAGLRVVPPVHYGWRSHGAEGLLHQDLFVLEK
jgi:ubiquinone/menaquinone biosynthesis C-methylase UbiE